MLGLAWITLFLWFPSSSLAVIILTFPDPVFVNVSYQVSWSRQASDPATFVIATSRVGEVDFVHANTTQSAQVDDTARKLQGQVTFVQKTVNPSRRVLRVLNATQENIVIGTSQDYSVLPVNSDPQNTVTATLFPPSATETATSSTSEIGPTTTANVPSDNSGSSTSSSTPTGAIAGGVVGGVIVVLLILALFYYVRRRRTLRKAKMIASPYQVSIRETEEPKNPPPLTRSLKTAPSSSELETSVVPLPPSDPTNSSASDGDTMSMRSATSNANSHSQPQPQSRQFTDLLHRIQILERSMAQQTLQAGGELDRLREELDALGSVPTLPPPYVGMTEDGRSEAGTRHS